MREETNGVIAGRTQTLRAILYAIPEGGRSLGSRHGSIEVLHSRISQSSAALSTERPVLCTDERDDTTIALSYCYTTTTTITEEELN